ncbi:MAG TPA: NAD(P)-dependent oxidoreductase [Gaiellaceae bacterium]|nr:NAD(P)-dependent oxidoreductase [Gaiellaceae bacterium]
MKVAAVGLGAMGSRIAGRLVDAGHDLTVWNRDASKAEPLVAAGAGAAESPAAAAAGAEVVVVMVTGPKALAAVTDGGDGLAAGLGAGAAVVQMSTVGLPALRRLAASLPAGALLDAPVLGSISEVEDGTLTVFAGGPPELVERLAPLLSTLGHVLFVGPVGAGTAAKLVANLTLVGTIGVLGEALALGRALELDGPTAFEVLAATPVGAQAERRRPAFESGDYPPRFSLSLARKDADLILEAARAAGIELRLAEAAQSWLADAEAAGYGSDDYSSVLERIVEP